MQPMYCTSQVSIFQWPSLLGLVQPVSAGLWEMSAAAVHAHAREQEMISVPLSVSSAANTSRDKR